MRISAVLLLVATLACAGHVPGRHARVAVSDDGRAAIVGGESWRAPEGVLLFERSGVLHVVSLVPGHVFDVAVEVGSDGRPRIPPDAPFAVSDGAVAILDRAIPPTARLVESGQLYAHDDHFHLTHLYDSADWEALYRARGEDAPFPPATRQVAALALATLLDMRIPGGSEERTAEAMRRMEDRISRARRAVEAELPAKQIMAMVVHDLEIIDGGKALTIEGRLFRAADEVRFSYCGDHFHVEHVSGAWSHAIRLVDAQQGSFELPPSMFFDVADGAVAERSGPLTWRALVPNGQVKLVGDGWYVGEGYALPAFARLQRAAKDPALAPPLRDAARRSVLEFLRVRLDVESDAAFRARLDSVDRAIESRWRELEAQIAPARRGRRR